ncbi:MAG TPA: DUF6152 family protein [Hyphomicrobiales bacterium]|nr:DUF6152 family protein [Hyphomicrobiales bacterium]
MRTPQALLIALAALHALALCSAPAQAHHSYAEYDQDERFVFSGTITHIFWGNPHILFTVDDGDTAMRIEWITVTGAIKTQVEATRFHVGDQLVVTGSRRRNPDMHSMTVIKTLELPAQEWQWQSPSGRRRSP